MKALVRKTALGGRKLEWPKEVVRLLEVGSNSVNLVDKIFSADNSLLSESTLDNRVIGKSNAGLVDLSETALVDKLTDSLQVGVPIGDVRVSLLKHVHGGLVHTKENSSVDLTKTEKL